MRDWLRYKLRRKLRKYYARNASRLVRGWERLRAAAGLPPSDPVVTSRYGVRMHANWADTTFQYCYFATYGRFLADYLGGQKSPFVFLDIGANQGLYSLVAARNPRCLQVIAVEPVAATFELLQRNLQANQLASRVVPIRAALSDRVGEARISVRSAHSGAATLSQGVNFDATHTQAVPLIDVHTLDQSLPAGARILVKVDVEGHEDVVIAQLLKSRHVQQMEAIFYEVNERWSDPVPLRMALQASGYLNFMTLGTGRYYDVLATRSGPTGRGVQ